MDRNTDCVLAVGQRPWHSPVGLRNVDPLAADGVPLDVDHAVHISAPRRTHQYRYHRQTSVNLSQTRVRIVISISISIGIANCR
jgi:hypothetical protein